MKVDKLSISLDATLGDAVRAAARREGKGVSGWLAEAAAAKLRAATLDAFLADWEAEHGALAEDELAKAMAELAINAPGTGSAA